MYQEHDPTPAIPSPSLARVRALVACSNAGCRDKRWQVCGRPGCLVRAPASERHPVAPPLLLSDSRPTDRNPMEDDQS